MKDPEPEGQQIIAPQTRWTASSRGVVKEKFLSIQCSDVRPCQDDSLFPGPPSKNTAE